VNDKEIEAKIQSHREEILELSAETLKLSSNITGSYRALLELVIRFNSVRSATTVYLEEVPDMSKETRAACEQINEACTKAIVHVMGYDAIMAQINPNVKRGAPDAGRTIN